MGSAGSLPSEIDKTSEDDLRKAFEDLPEKNRQKLMAAMTPKPKPGVRVEDWIEAFGVFDRFHSKDVATTKKLMLADAQIQVKEEAGSPWFIVLGAPSSDSNPPLNEKERVYWLATHRSKETYQAQHASRQSSKTCFTELMKTAKSGHPGKDMTGSYRGLLYYLEQPGVQVSGTLYVLLTTVRARDPESADSLLEHWVDENAASMLDEPQQLQCVLIPSVLFGGDVPDAGPKDGRVLRMVQVFKSASVMKAFKGSQGGNWVDNGWIEDPYHDIATLEFESSHFAK